METKIKCIIVDDEPMAREILEGFVAKVSQLILLKSCINAMEAFEIVNTAQVDLIFLDINMPEVSGLTLAESVHKNTKIIFTTAYREYAIDGFNLHAVDYLLKPIAFGRFLEAVQKLFEITNIQINKKVSEEVVISNKFIFVRADRKMVKVNFEEIIYVESLSDYIKVHTLQETITTRETIKNMEAKLPYVSFLRIHRSYIVSIDKITSYTNEFVELDKKVIPISRSYKESILEKLKKT